MAGRTAAQAGPAYRAAADATWRHLPDWPQEAGGLERALVHYARLAANSHNTQPWLFEPAEGGLLLRPDPARRCPAVDPDDHHLYASLGCAAENLWLAARAAGREAAIGYDPARGAIAVALDGRHAVAEAGERLPAFEAIPLRASTRAPYDGRELPPDLLAALERAAAQPGVTPILLAGRQRLAVLRDYVLAGNTAQCRDRAFLAELRDWVRFDTRQALARRDGLFAGCTGNPQLPPWLGRLAFRFAVTPRALNPGYAAQVDSAAGALVLVAEDEGPLGWIQAGRAAQRFQLEAAALGVKSAWLNQPVEVPQLRGEFASWLGIGGRRPDLVLRFGLGPEMPRSLRRPVEAVLRPAAWAQAGGGSSSAPASASLSASGAPR